VRNLGGTPRARGNSREVLGVVSPHPPRCIASIRGWSRTSLRLGMLVRPNTPLISTRTSNLGAIYISSSVHCTDHAAGPAICDATLCRLKNCGTASKGHDAK
jgi:hypothetical protein